MRYSLKPYIAFAKGPASEAACLVFARNAREARNVSWKEVGSLWYDSESFLDWRVRLADRRDWDYFYEREADKGKLEKGIPHTIECPKSCKYCGRWGGRLVDGVCERCLMELKDDEKINQDEKIEKLLNLIEELSEKFKRYCHTPDCKKPDICPSRHPSCRKKLDLDTSLAWEAATALFHIKWDIQSGALHSDSIEGLEMLCNVVRRHSTEYPHLFSLFEEAEAIRKRIISMMRNKRQVMSMF